jgi:hypothetical protein
MPDCRSRIYLEMLERMCYDMRSDARLGVGRANSEYAVFAALRGSEWQNRRGLALFWPGAERLASHLQVPGHIK